MLILRFSERECVEYQPNIISRLTESTQAINHVMMEVVSYTILVITIGSQSRKGKSEELKNDIVVEADDKVDKFHLVIHYDHLFGVSTSICILRQCLNRWYYFYGG
jgi:hypothetical protein